MEINDIMTIEMVIPNNNEKEFVDIAGKLGIKKIIFLYHFDENIDLNEKFKVIEPENLDMELGLIVNNSNFNQASKKSRIIVAKSSDKARILMESKKITHIYGFEETSRKDFFHQRASGLNHIMCDIAHSNNITTCFSYRQLFDKNENTALIMGRMMQNIKLCKKYKVKSEIVSFATEPHELRSPHDVKMFFKLLGYN